MRLTLSNNMKEVRSHKLIAWMAALVAGQTRRFPGFICIGAQRCGTTWLHANLSRHPGVWLPPAKEVHYFDQRHGVEAARWAPIRRAYLERLTADGADGVLRRWAERFADSDLVDDDWYADLFHVAPRGALLGDITPAYALLDDAGVAHAARLMPEARIVYMLRHPAERMLSGAWHELAVGRSDGKVPSLGEFLDELQGERCRRRSGYHQAISVWSAHFRPERFKVLFHDDVISRPHEVLREVCAHLGIAYSDEFFPSAATPVNEGRPMPEAYRLEGMRLARASCREELRRLSALIGPLPARWA